ncbi:MAG TPA: Fic family protein [Fredinandcohnia sp.]|nr:Fic family protein [Fredinandcohnia sp.]
MDAKAFLHLDERNAALQAYLEADPDVADTFRRTYLISWIYHENALDGLVLTDEEISVALEQQVAAEPSSQNVLGLIRAHRKALDRIEAEARSRRGKITVELLEEIYRWLIESGRPTPKEKAIWRQEIPLHRTYLHDLADPKDIRKGLEQWQESLASGEFRELHPVEQAATAHWEFMQVFPFAEHNGRIGRLIQAFYLLRAGHMAPVMHATTRQAYYQSLRHSPESLTSLLARAMEDAMENCRRYLQSLREKRAS